MKMKVYCRTNLDLSNEQWPDELPALPNVGDHIQSLTKHNHFRLELQVVRITWKYHDYHETWIPEIELHMTDFQRSWRPSKNTQEEGACQGSITAFYEWYAPKVGRSVGAFI